jgi:uncharacterized phage protein (TIGR01671 family)
MRDIKFRRYSKLLDKFSMIDSVWDLNYQSWNKRDSHNMPISEMGFEQFTGLTDINDNPIYEGDIVESYHYSSGGVDYFKNHIIEWSDKFNGWFALNAESQDEEDGSVQLWVYVKSNKFSMKVIGNIYQNQELTGETK